MAKNMGINAEIKELIRSEYKIYLVGYKRLAKKLNLKKDQIHHIVRYKNNLNLTTANAKTKALKMMKNANIKNEPIIMERKTNTIRQIKMQKS